MLLAASTPASVPLAAQAVAPLPVAAFHDSRFAIVFASSWPGLAALLAVMVLGRGLLHGAIAWSTGRDALRAVAEVTGPAARGHPGRPASRRQQRWWRLAARSAGAEAVLLVAMSPSAFLAFTAGVTSIEYPLLAAIGATVLLGTLVLPHAGATPRWWARRPPWRPAAWCAASFAASALVALPCSLAVPGHPALAVATASAGGAVNGWCLQRLLKSAARRSGAGRRSAGRRSRGPRRLRSAVVASLSLLLVLVLLVVVASTAFDELGASFTIGSAAPPPPPRRGQQTVMLVDGFDSRWDGGAPMRSFPGYYTTEFSYAGLGAAGEPLPYASRATFAPIDVLARRFARQVTRLARLSGRPVDIVAISEGTLVLRRYLAAHPRPPVRLAVLASPLVSPDRVWMPASTARNGPGLLATAEASLFLAIVHAENPIDHFGVDEPLLRSLLDGGSRFRFGTLCPVAGVRLVALVPLSAALVDPPGAAPAVPVIIVPAMHATIVTSGAERPLLLELLRAGRAGPLDGLGSGAWWDAYEAARGAAAAFMVPTLPLTAVRAWRASFAGRDLTGCR